MSLLKSLSTAVVLCGLAAGASADLVITEAMSNSSHPGGAANGDWWELTNTGSSAVDLTGYSWDDDSLTAGTSIFPVNIIIGAGQSIVIVDENVTNLPTFVSDWGGGFTALSKDDFGGTTNFPGLGSSGDQIALFDASNTLIDLVNTDNQASPNGGTSFFFSLTPSTTARDGTRSFIGDSQGSHIAVGDGAGSAGTDFASPGVIPEPASLVLCGFSAVLVLRRRHT